MADLTVEIGQSHAEAPHQTGYSVKEKSKLKIVQSIAHKFDEAKHPRDKEGQFALYHGTSDEFAEKILKEGLKPLSDIDTDSGVVAGKAFASTSEKVAISYAALSSDASADTITVIVFKPEANQYFKPAGKRVFGPPGSWPHAISTEMSSTETVPPELIQEIRQYRLEDVLEVLGPRGSQQRIPGAPGAPKQQYADWESPLEDLDPVKVVRKTDRIYVAIPTRSGAKKFDINQPRGPKGTSQGGRWVKGSGGTEHWVGEGTPTEPVVGRKFTSEEGYQWHEKGPGAKWAKETLTYEDANVLSSYAGFTYRQINDFRRGKPPTTEGRIRPLTPEEYAKVQAAPSGEAVQKMIPPEGPEFRYSWSFENIPKDTPGGPGYLQAHWVVKGPVPDPERLAEVTEKAVRIDDLIANRGVVLDEAMVVERGAYLPGVSAEDLAALEQEIWEEKGFTSTMLGDAGNRARSYPALGKWESIYHRYGGKPNSLVDHQDEVGTAVRFYITLPKGTKVAPVEAARRVRHDFPRVQDPSVFEHPEWTADGTTKPEDYTISDYTQKPTVNARDLDSKDYRMESEILLGSGARFRVTKVRKGYTYQTGDATLKPVEVYEVHMEYIGGGSSEGAH
jgi:hypothetical protein